MSVRYRCLFGYRCTGFTLSDSKLVRFSSVRSIRYVCICGGMLDVSTGVSVRIRMFRYRDGCSGVAQVSVRQVSVPEPGSDLSIRHRCVRSDLDVSVQGWLYRVSSWFQSDRHQCLSLAQICQSGTVLQFGSGCSGSVTGLQSGCQQSLTWFKSVRYAGSRSCRSAQSVRSGMHARVSKEQHRSCRSPCRHAQVSQGDTGAQRSSWHQVP